MEWHEEIEPSHYRRGDIECINVIKAVLSDEAYRGFLKGNVIKYIFRESEKGRKRDLEKAQWYLKRLIECV